ncbi:hypothetical protein [Streptomyces griseorubiginosus]|uniref:hypothetical protein n=1 Tax=Streptomyces griseorubiginosus TaxID=67304 RepID=UPI002E822A9B|nr:hypothetical protein [Streptomyces griseorubiginosus]WUB46212.1 hypothetical protein OHN19_23915 [Streptomyces griseorubiginosus]WUB54733.1 hypothetical protein OG942_23915 [Streptomyces griseorubiginosus]
MSPRERHPNELKRIPEQQVSPHEIRWLAQVEVARADLEERWGPAELTRDDFAEWWCFAFAPAEGEAFLLLRAVRDAPADGFILSATSGLFSPRAADLLVRGLGVPGGRVVRLNADAVAQSDS